MSDLLKEITSRATALSPEERAQLAEVMLESLQEGNSAEVDAAWDQELQSRIAAYERGESKLVSAKDVFDEARRLTTSQKSGSSTRRELSSSRRLRTTRKLNAGSAHDSEAPSRRPARWQRGFPMQGRSGSTVRAACSQRTFHFPTLN